jgi:hypothetical protein
MVSIAGSSPFGLKIDEGEVTADDLGSTALKEIWELIDSQVLTGSANNISFATINAKYIKLMFHIKVRSDWAGQANDNLALSVNADTTDANYAKQQLAISGGTVTGASGNDRNIGSIPAATATASSFGEIILILDNSSETLHHGFTATGGHGPNLKISTGTWKNTDAITTVTLAPGTGTNFITGSKIIMLGLQET